MAVLMACSKDDTKAEAVNNPPNIIYVIGVTNNAQSVDVFPTFTWYDATDPDSDAVTYNLYLDMNENLIPA